MSLASLSIPLPPPHTPSTPKKRASGSSTPSGSPKSGKHLSSNNAQGRVSPIHRALKPPLSPKPQRLVRPPLVDDFTARKGLPKVGTPPTQAFGTRDGVNASSNNTGGGKSQTSSPPPADSNCIGLASMFLDALQEREAKGSFPSPALLEVDIDGAFKTIQANKAFFEMNVNFNQLEEFLSEATEAQNKPRNTYAEFVNSCKRNRSSSDDLSSSNSVKARPHKIVRDQ